MDEQSLQELKRLIGEFEVYERQIHSEKIKLPSEWFWHGQFIVQLRNLHDSIEKGVHELEYYEQRSAFNDLKTLTEYLDRLLKLLDKELKPIEEENYFYKPKQAEEINQTLQIVDNYLISLLQKFKVFETHYAADAYAQKKKILMELGLNIFKYPELTQMILSDWSIIEDMLKLYPARYMDRNTRIHYMFGTLPLFNDIIFQKLSDSEIKAIRDSITAKPNQTQEEIYKDPYLFDNLKDFQNQLSLRKAALYKKGRITLKQTVLLLFMIIMGGTVGEDLGARVVGTYIPNLRKMIRNRNDIEVIYTHTKNMYKVHVLAPRYIIGGILPNFSEMYYKWLGRFLVVFQNVLEKDKNAYYALGYNILFFKALIRTPKDLEEIGMELVKTYVIWSKWREEKKDITMASDPSSAFQELLVDKHLVRLNSVDDAKFLLRFMQKTNSLWLLALLFSKNELIRKEEDFFIKLIEKTEYPELFFRILMEITSGDISKLHEYHAIIESIAHNVNEFKTNIAPYEKNLLEITHFLKTVDELEYLLRILGDYDTNLLHNLFEVLKFLKPYQITSFKLFLENGGREILESIKQFKEVKTDWQILAFCSAIISASNPKNYKELLNVFNKAFSFVNREVEDNRIKLRQLTHISNISKSIFRYFGDYLLYIMEQSPKNFMKILFSIGRILQINANITKDILQLAKIARTFRLFINENKVEGINLQDIENTYLFLTQQLNKKPDIDKFRKNLKKFGTQHSKSAFDFINNLVMNLSIEYFLTITRLHVKDAFEKYCGVPLPKELDDSDDAVNALLVGRACSSGRNINLAKTFLKEVCLKNTVPFKQYPEAYPYNQQKNIDFVKAMEARGINMHYWINGFKKDYKPALTDMLENTEKIIANHVAEIIEEYKTLGLEVKESEIFEKFDEIKDNPNQSTVIDIKNHLKQIKSLQGQNFYIHSIKKVTIYIETNPLKVLQMGNVVSGSCLALGGGNSWTTITDALDANKRVLYAENEKGIILGRRLITMTNEGKIIQYGVYNNAPQIDIDNLFQQFTIELAQKCNATVADMGDTATLIGESWYAGTPIQPFRLQLVHS